MGVMPAQYGTGWIMAQDGSEDDKPTVRVVQGWSGFACCWVLVCCVFFLVVFFKIGGSTAPNKDFSCNVKKAKNYWGKTMPKA